MEESSMKYTLNKQVRENDLLRESFMDLALRTFGISFKDWYQNGYWTERYIPYALACQYKVIANASVNQIDTVWKGVKRRYIQIGTVMTDPAYRNQGLMRRLLQEILSDWKERCDAIYLYANDTVLDFYPKFGFVKAVEHQYVILVRPCPGDFEKLDMSTAAGREILRKCYERSNPYSELASVGNFGLLMFYCMDSMKGCVYYSHKYDTVCIAELGGERLECFDIFGNPSVSLEMLLSALAVSGTQHAALGFTPKIKGGLACMPTEEDDSTLFVLSGKENPFGNNKIMMPILSHA